MSPEQRGAPVAQAPATDRASTPDSPLEVAAIGWRDTLKRTKVRITRDRVPMAAGSLAYHFFLATFPAIIAALGVLTLINIGSSTLTHLINGIGKALPAGSAGVFQAAVRAATRRAAGSAVAVAIGVVVSLWSASSAMAVLQQALDVAYEVPRDRKFLARRLHALPLMAATVVLGGAGAAMIVFGQPIGSAIHGALGFGGAAITVGWTVVRWVATFALITLLFSALYFLGPNRDSPSWQWVSPGGLVGTVIFLVASLGFSYYVSAFGSYGKTYGSFAGVAIFIFWLYLTGIAILVGAELNAEIEKQAVARAAGRHPETVDATTPGGAPAAESAGGSAAAVPSRQDRSRAAS